MIFNGFYENRCLHIVSELMGISLLDMLKDYNYDTHFPSIKYIKYIVFKVFRNYNYKQLRSV